MREIELKYRLAGPAALRSRLAELGARREKYVLEKNTLFDTARGELRKQGCGLRLREEAEIEGGAGQTVRLTYKGPREPDSLVKIREELETKVVDGDAMRGIITQLGMHATVHYEKRRETWHLGDCEICVDELPDLGWFVEVEGPSESSVAAACAQLGLPEADIVAETYVEMAHKVGRADSDGTISLHFNG